MYVFCFVIQLGLIQVASQTSSCRARVPRMYVCMHVCGVAYEGICKIEHAYEGIWPGIHLISCQEVGCVISGQVVHMS